MSPNAQYICYRGGYTIIREYEFYWTDRDGYGCEETIRAANFEEACGELADLYPLDRGGDGICIDANGFARDIIW